MKDHDHLVLLLAVVTVVMVGVVTLLLRNAIVP